MKRIPLIEATASQLADFATANLGLDVQFRMGSDRIRAVMATANYTKDYIEVDEPEPVAAQEASTKDQRPKVTIIISAQEGPGGDQPVPVSVNGRAMWIERAKPSAIPYPYYEALKNAVKVVYDPDPNGGMKPPRNVQVYPFTVLSGLAA